MKKEIILVIYTKDLIMREREFKISELKQAEEFCKEVNGSICTLSGR